MHRPTQPRCIVIAGPNGAGKTTFAREYLPKVAGLVQFVNADLIAQGLSPLDPRLAEIAYLRLSSPGLALRRIAARVRQGGHDVPRGDVIRRFGRGWENFVKVYRPLANEWAVYDNSAKLPKLIERWP